MAKVFHGNHLQPGSKIINYIGYFDTYNEKQLILTKSRSVEAYKNGDQKLHRSWSAKANLPFTCPVIYRQDTDDYIAVCNHNALLKWKSETQDLTKVKAVKVKQRIHCLKVSLSGKTFVFFESGCVSSLEAVLEKTYNEEQNLSLHEEKILNCWITEKSEVEYCILLTLNSKNEYTLKVLQDLESANEVKSYRVSPPVQGCQLQDIQLKKDAKNIEFISVWNNGELWSHTLSDVTLDLEERKLMALQSSVTSPMMSLAVLDSCHVAISPLKNIHKDQADNSVEYLTIWNTNFGTLQAHQRIPPTSHRDSNKSTLFSCHDYLFAITDESTMMFQYQITSGSLLSALGMVSMMTDIETGSNQFDLQWKMGEDQNVAVVSKDKVASKEKVMKILDGSSRGASSYLLKSEIKNLLHQQPSCFEELLKDVLKRLEGNPSHAMSVTALEKLIQESKAVGSMSDHLIDALCEKQRAEFVLLYLGNMQDIPDAHLVKCLQFFISLSEDKLPKQQINGESKLFENAVTTGCPFSSLRAWCINKVLQQPFNDVFALPFLRKIKFDEAVVFLKYLHFLKICDELLANSDISQEKVVDWMSVTLDAHFTQLIMSPDTKPLLIELQTSVHIWTEYESEIKAVNNFLQALKVEAEMKAKQPIKGGQKRTGRYAIEVLKL